MTDESFTDFSCVSPHPYGVLPGGNQYFHASSSGVKKQIPLTDELFQQVLSYSDGKSLGRSVQTCREWYVAGHQPELWRDLVLRQNGESIRVFTDSWKDTFVRLLVENEVLWKPHIPMAVTGVYSDFYYRTHLCRSFAIPPAWKKTGGSVPRVTTSLSTEEFLDKYETPNRPVVLAGAARSWGAFRKWKNTNYWSKSANERLFRATSGAAPLPANFTVEAYHQYATSSNLEEAPLYLFDRTALLDGQLKEDYYPDLQRTCPFWDPARVESNGHDLFQCLGEGRRPDHTWLIIGPKRSGSAFHMDPNATHAWNTAIVGRKRWIFYPPGVTPPGVHPSRAGDQVAMPISLGEWLLNYYTTEHLPNLTSPDNRSRPMECTVEAGDILFVPHGWWHLVVNLDDVNIAVTHNYASRSNLPSLLRFIDKKQDQLSGCRDRAESVKPEDLREEFRKALARQGHGDWWNEAEAIARGGWICNAWTDDPEKETATCNTVSANKSHICKKRKHRTDESAVASESSIMAKAKQSVATNQPFSFSFL